MIHSKNSGTVNARAVYQTTDTILECAKIYAGGISGRGLGGSKIDAAENFGKITASSSDSLYIGGVSASLSGAASVRNLGDIDAHAKYLILGGIAGFAASLQGSYNVAKSITYTIDDGIADTTIGILTGVVYSKPTACGYLKSADYSDLPAMGNRTDSLDSFRFSEEEMKTETFAAYLNSTKADTSFHNRWFYAGDYPIFADSVYVSSFKTKARPVLNLSLYVSDHTIHILNGKQDLPFAVVDLRGHIIKRGRIASPDESIQISRSGVYFVKTGSKVQRVLIK